MNASNHHWRFYINILFSALHRDFIQALLVISCVIDPSKSQGDKFITEFTVKRRTTPLYQKWSDVENRWQSKWFNCIERERKDLVGGECTPRETYSADTVRRCTIESSATTLEIAYAVASARQARSMKAKIGRLEHRSATSAP
eukprot:IDg6958t1